MIDPLAAVSTVYVLTDLQHKLANIDGVRAWHSHEKLTHCRRELVVALNRESRDLARAFYDYIVTVAAGEARHAGNKYQVYWENFPTSGDERRDAWKEAKQYTPESLLVALKDLFACKWCDSSFGGPKWGKIVEAGLMYKKTPPMLFLDRVVDLSHNGGLFLDKGVIFYPPDDQYLSFLNFKAEGLIWNRDYVWWPVGIHESSWPQAIDAMQLLGIPLSRCIQAGDPQWEDEIVEWGSMPFVPETVDRGYDWEPKSDEGESEEEEEEDDVEAETDEHEHYVEPVAVR